MSIHSTARLVLPVGPRDHIRGPATAPITLVEYGDFECPYCGEAYVVLNAVCRSLANDLRFVFRHFPLTQMHPHAQNAG
jgi:protein-disulfide isomerase